MTTQHRPKVSIIIPVYNDEEYVKDAIESALAQTYSDLEVVVVDDGSTDRTPKILKRYEREIVLVTQENQGAGGSRNAGISASRGEYLSFLDSDDMFLPEKTALQVALLDAHPEVGLVYGVCLAISEQDGRVIKKTRVEQGIRDKNRGPFPPTYPTPSFTVRREWIEKVGCFDGEMRWAMDTDLRFKLWAAGCSFMPHRDVVTLYRIKMSGLSSDPAEQARMHLRALERHFESMGDAIPERVRHEHLAMTWLRTACGHALNEETAEAGRAFRTAVEAYSSLFELYESWALVLYYFDLTFPLPDPNWSPRFSEIWGKVSSFLDHDDVKAEHRLSHRAGAKRAALAYALSRRAFLNRRGLAARWWFIRTLLINGGKLPRDAKGRHVIQTLAGSWLTRLAASIVPALSEVKPR